MISAPTGSRPNVIGSAKATTATGPMPGSSPAMTPIKAPVMQKKTLPDDRSTVKP
jgi:hypothetical protein